MSDAAISANITWADHADAVAVAAHLAAAIERQGARLLAVPGGSTPVAIFDKLSTMDLPWSELSLILTDDRIVAKDHEASNFGKLTKAFADSDAKLIDLTEGMTPPRADLVWVGMGADGHIASLFPTMKAPVQGDEASPLVVRTVPDPLPPEAPFERLSLNMAALIDTNAIIIVVRGADKKTILEQAIKEEHDLPIAKLIKAASCPITIFWSES
ncbi:6-phosphogluconolactonase [Parasphingorhabdus litoris]|uniref:6-phosphogluconolactonase n=1 Tax=Parasphingorhabdus litoris TaxID=394733 RepID=A0ABN1AYG5_9SPHN|nr:6-phosphogluconolactonase [Parasphingorhabdus litoris]